MFRHEALADRDGSSFGDVSVGIPTSWQVVGYLVGGSVIAVILFLSLARYTRVETVSGIVAPAAGVSLILPVRSGVVTSLPIHDGQLVRAGTVLAAIRAEEDSASGATAGARLADAIARQDIELAAQNGAAQAAAQAQLYQLAAQRTGLAAEVVQLRSQIELQRELVASVERDLNRARPVAARGFISSRDMQQREEALLSRRQGLSQLTQALAAKQAAATEAERNAAQIVSESRAQSAGLSAARAGVAQQAAANENSRSYVLRAPIAGRVTAVTARVGQPAITQTPLMTILPTRSELRAELAVPSAAIGFVKPGQEVRIAIDAFPYQRFGTVTGTVLTVAASATPRETTNGTVASAYPVTVKLGSAAIDAFGRREPLLAGMTLTARIVTERQSLLTWLFEPLLAVQRR